MSANLNAVEVLQGVVSTPAALEAVLNQGAMIVNDYVITIEAVDGGYKLIARRGSDEQAMVILNGVDAPVPEIDVETVQGGHKVIAAVGDTVKSFTVKDGVDGRDGVDGKDGISPVINVTDIENGHRVTITTGSNVQSFDVVDGKDGKSAVSPTVSVTEIEGGHRVTINSEGKTDSFDVLNGKDGEGGGGGTSMTDLETIAMLADNDLLPAITDGSGKILTDAKNTIMLRY